MISDPVAFESEAASLAWSKAGSRVPFSASTKMNSLAPPARSLRYQNRVLSASQRGLIRSLKTKGAPGSPRPARCCGESDERSSSASIPAPWPWAEQASSMTQAIVATTFILIDAAPGGRR